jgi:N-acetylmuramoyl-L-alanine amidase
MLITVKILKRVKLKNVSFMILLLKTCIIFGQPKVIIIDPGHGGKDSGAIGINGIQEKDIVLDIASEILCLNKKLETPLNIYLTRYIDTLISLSDRTKLVKALNADVFISLHCNHSDNPNARGIEVFVANTTSQYSKDAAWLAFQLQAVFRKKLGFESRGVKFANFQVLRDTIDYCPSVLLELGFLSNRDENEYYQNSANFQVWATVLLESLIKKFSCYERVGD